MNTCRGCEHFEREKDGYGECERVSLDGEIWHPDMMDSENGIEPFQVWRGFGCIHWEEKENKT